MYTILNTSCKTKEKLFVSYMTQGFSLEGFCTNNVIGFYQHKHCKFAKLEFYPSPILNIHMTQ